MGSPTGQRVQLLTFSGSVYVNTKQVINTSNGVVTPAGATSQELSGNVESDALPIRGAATANGTLTLTGQPVAIVAATGALTLTGQPLDTETVTVGAKTFTFQAVLTNVDGNVLIGALATDSLDNLIAAIRLAAGAGTLYATATTSPGEVVAVDGLGDTMDVTAVIAGTAGNALVTTETITNGSWNNATLTGGLDAETVTIGTKTFTFQDMLTNVDGNVLIGATASDSLDNLMAAINLSAGAGTLYAAATTSPGEVVASLGAGDVLGVESSTGGVSGNTLVSTETLTNGSWNNATLGGGLVASESHGYFNIIAT